VLDPLLSFATSDNQSRFTAQTMQFKNKPAQMKALGLNPIFGGVGARTMLNAP